MGNTQASVGIICQALLSLSKLDPKLGPHPLAAHWPLRLHAATFTTAFPAAHRCPNMTRKKCLFCSESFLRTKT